MGLKELVDVDLYLHHETKVGKEDEGAIFVSEDKEGKKRVWLPKSQVTFERTKGDPNGAAYTVTMPDWLATKHGWT